MSAWSDEAGRIVETAFAAAVDDALWATLTEEVIAATGAAGSFLGILDHTTGYAARCVLTNANGRAYDEYVGGMAVLDPQARKVAMVDRAGVYTCQDHVDWDDPTTADYMKWQEDRLGWHGHVTVAMKLDERHACGMSFHLMRDETHRVEAVRNFLDPISDALGQALQLGFLHNDKLTHEYWQGASAGLDPRGALLISERGVVLRMNAMAERLVTAGQGFTLRGGRIACRNRREQARLDAMVDRAIQKVAPQPGVALLGGGGGEAGRWFARISPIVRRRRIMVIDEPAALLTVRPLEEHGKAMRRCGRTCSRSPRRRRGSPTSSASVSPPTRSPRASASAPAPCAATPR